MKNTETLNLATQKLNEVLREAISSEKQILFLLAGGSCLDLLDKVDDKNLNDRVTIAPLDERFSIDPLENNMALISQTDFYKKAQKYNCKFIDTRVKEKTMYELTDRFNKELSIWIKNNPYGTIIATVGIGTDGHIAGIMPFPENPEKFKTLFDSDENDRLVVGYDATGKNKYTQRVTTTMKMLRKIDKAIVYAAGENKRVALQSFNESKIDLAKTPSQVLKEIKGNVYLFTDIIN